MLIPSKTGLSGVKIALVLVAGAAVISIMPLVSNYYVLSADAISALGLTIVLSASIVGVFAGPQLLFWQRDSEFLTTLALSASTKSTHAARRIAVMIIRLSLPGFVMLASTAEQWSNLLAAGLSVVLAVFLAVPLAIVGATLSTSEIVAKQTKSMQAPLPSTMWLGTIPALGAFAVIAAALVTRMHANQGQYSDAVLLGGLSVGAALVITVPVLTKIARHLDGAFPKIIAMNASSLATIAANKNGTTDKLIAKLCGSARGIYLKDQKLMSRRYPMAGVGLTVLPGIWIIGAWQDNFMAAVVAAVLLHAILPWRILRVWTLPIEHPSVGALSISAAHIRRTKIIATAKIAIWIGATDCFTLYLNSDRQLVILALTAMSGALVTSLLIHLRSASELIPRRSCPSPS